MQLYVSDSIGTVAYDATVRAATVHRIKQTAAARDFGGLAIFVDDLHFCDGGR
jgi:hypothetical protein